MTLNTELIILPEADRDIEDILQYTLEVWGEEQEAAYWSVLWDAFTRIRQFPEIGRPQSTENPHIRELHLAHHTVVYRREPSQIVILRIVNPRRRRR